MFLWAAWPSDEQLAELGHFPKIYLCLALFMVDQCGATRLGRTLYRRKRSRRISEIGSCRRAGRCNGYGFWAVAVQPYFDRNIFLNHGGPEAHAFHHFGVAYERRVNVLEEWEAQIGPPFILFAVEDTNEAPFIIHDLESWNYRLVRTADGNRFFKSVAGTHSLYLIFERTDQRLRHH